MASPNVIILCASFTILPPLTLDRAPHAGLSESACFILRGRLSTFTAERSRVDPDVALSLTTSMAAFPRDCTGAMFLSEPDGVRDLDAVLYGLFEAVLRRSRARPRSRLRLDNSLRIDLGGFSALIKAGEGSSTRRRGLLAQPGLGRQGFALPGFDDFATPVHPTRECCSMDAEDLFWPPSSAPTKTLAEGCGEDVRGGGKARRTLHVTDRR